MPYFYMYVIKSLNLVPQPNHGGDMETAHVSSRFCNEHIWNA